MIKLLFLCAYLAVPNQDTLPNQLPLLHPIRQADFKYISSKYGWRIDPVTKDSTFHEGIDIATIDTNECCGLYYRRWHRRNARL